MKKKIKSILQRLNILKKRAELPFALSYFSIPRVYSLSNALYDLESSFTPEEIESMYFVECGIGYGESFSFIAWFAERFNSNLIGFDSFEGFPEPTHDLDQRKFGPPTKKGQWNVNSKELILSKLRNMKFSGTYIDTRVELVKGYFENTLTTYDFKKKICFLNLDVDLYSSYETCLEGLAPHIAQGGVICLDEYHSDKWNGCKKAVDEFLLNKQFKLIEDLSTQRAYLKKV